MIVYPKTPPSVPIQEGACVMLRSGGPNMLVKRLVGVHKAAECVWVNNGRLITRIFYLDLIVPIGDAEVFHPQLSERRRT